MRIIDRGILVVIGRARIEPAGVDGGKRTTDKGFAEALAIDRDRDRLAEIEVAVEFTNGLFAFIGFTPAITGEVHAQGITDGAGTELQAGRRIVFGRAPQGFDIAFGLFKVGEVARTGNSLNVTIGPGRETVVHLVEIRELIALFVDFPVVGIAAHDDDVVRTILDRHPGTHHRNVEILGREGVLVLFVGIVRVAGVLGLEDVARTRAERAIGHGIEILRGERFLEGPLDRVGIECFERCALTEGLRRAAVEWRDVLVEDVILPVEHHVIGIKRIAIGPFCTLDQMHGQFLAVLGPFPALGKVRHGLEFVGLDHEQRTGARQTFG